MEESSFFKLTSAIDCLNSLQKKEFIMAYEDEQPSYQITFKV